jgi:hypothetical protein
MRVDIEAGGTVASNLSGPEIQTTFVRLWLSSQKIRVVLPDKEALVVNRIRRRCHGFS